jgi:hypothetical protein
MADPTSDRKTGRAGVRLAEARRPARSVTPFLSSPRRAGRIGLMTAACLH